MRRTAHCRRRPNACLGIALLAFLAGVPSGLVRAAQTAGKESPGYTVFVAKGCFECHGYRGQGSLFTGPPLAPNPISLAAMQAYVRAPSGQMPPYSSSILTDAELAQIHDYLSSLPAPPPPEKIRLLPQITAALNLEAAGVQSEISFGEAMQPFTGAQKPPEAKEMNAIEIRRAAVTRFGQATHHLLRSMIAHELQERGGTRPQCPDRRTHPAARCEPEQRRQARGAGQTADHSGAHAL